MMCVFFCLSSKCWVVNMFQFSRSNIFSDRKMNIVGTLRKTKLKIPISFRKHLEKQKNENFYANQVYYKNDFEFLFNS